jgi:hypothetical protein
VRIIATDGKAIPRIKIHIRIDQKKWAACNWNLQRYVNTHNRKDFFMIRVAIVDQSGKVLLPKDLATAAELKEAAAQAKALIQDCERLAQLKEPKVAAPRKGGLPYMT